MTPTRTSKLFCCEVGVKFHATNMFSVAYGRLFSVRSSLRQTGFMGPGTALFRHVLVR